MQQHRTGSHQYIGNEKPVVHDEDKLGQRFDHFAVTLFERTDTGFSLAPGRYVTGISDQFLRAPFLIGLIGEKIIFEPNYLSLVPDTPHPDTGIFRIGRQHPAESLAVVRHIIRMCEPIEIIYIGKLDACLGKAQYAKIILIETTDTGPDIIFPQGNLVRSQYGNDFLMPVIYSLPVFLGGHRV